ncbi:RICIN domain-containing protein [Amycolatopsis sp. PS_44_ISF1]|uniref:RICIN domain-containing protein n=1 Tax=Amycolatopsis sp. PS_44_ISF1 TaxID=2974917 RepID=UPI0028DD78EC|nr:RICIN domain-containing protein [Amycolatopsis sp. PS_44_ISF1]MDT8912580.1 RICIN domain-containing protein [Amycolatopsis sp. PS_44_ISF1]
MPTSRRPVLAVVAVVATGLIGVPGAAAAVPATVSVGAVGPYAYPTDTPASAFTDRDGTFYFQQSAALYGQEGPREWEFYTGADFDSATKSAALSTAVNPAEPRDRNNDTTWRCNTSPTGKEATDPPAGSGYTQKNFCDLLGTWVDPDTGDWYGLVHNEFTPEPFGAYSFSHYDSIDWAVSADRGRTWRIKGHAITSPYSTKRGDTTAFPHQTFDYGDGDPRLFADPKSGYFYVYYGSRIVPKAGAGGQMVALAHVARAPMSGKMGTGTWQKWYDGRWSEPGVGGRESNMVPVDAGHPQGYTPVAQDYDPANTGNVDQQVAAGKVPSKSPLLVMNIAYDAHLGLYLGEPEVVDQSHPAPQQLYVTDDLATQKWRLIGDTGAYRSGSWYRWMVDNANRTNPTIIGRTFRSYCSIQCAGSDGEYADYTVDGPSASPVDPARTYRLASGTGRVLTQVPGSSATTSVFFGWGDLAAWRFVPTGDGAYRITNASTGLSLGVSDTPGDRAWGTRLTAAAPDPGRPSVGRQWFVIPLGGGGYRLVNRYSGLVLGLSAQWGRQAETTPQRSWTNRTGSPVGGTRTAAEQTIGLTAIRGH